MRYILERTISLEVGSRFLEHFIKSAFSSSKQLKKTELCVHPGGFALDNEGQILRDKCVGCILCVEFGEYNSIDYNSVPLDEGKISLEKIASKCFNGEFYQFNDGDRFSLHTESNETKITNPMGASYLVQLSYSPSSIYICSSPSNECSIQKFNVVAEREGHLDISVINTELRELFVLEGKKNVRGFINDRVRDQWEQYLPAVNSIAESFEINSTLCYLIGGSELDMYPDGEGPKSRLHANFKRVVDSDMKKFISLEALRAMKASKLTLNNELNWERDLVPLVNQPSFVGLVTGGVIYREDGVWVLKKAPWI